MEVAGGGDDQRYSIVCPDDGKNCECWIECPEDHPCDCGSSEHEHDKLCDADCDENHALDCDEWVWRDGMLHGQFHQHIGSMLCIKDSGCWMPSWTIEFDQINHNFEPGLYEFDFEDPDPDDDGLLYILAMRPAVANA